MKFLVDAQLPARLARALSEAGHDAIHTSHLPRGNHSRDAEVTETADREGRVVVTKDGDFRDDHLLNGRPQRLLVIATGNIANSMLLDLLDRHLSSVVAAFDEADFVALDRHTLVVHGGPNTA